MKKTIHNKVAVVGVVHPGVVSFIDDYLLSLEKQTCRKFDLLIANDNVSNMQSIMKDTSLVWASFNVTGSPASIRRALICKALELNYEILIFTDCDDYFKENRIEENITLLENASIVVNDLDIVSQEKEKKFTGYFSQRFKEGQDIFARDILKGNLMGFTNTSARSDVFEDSSFLISGDAVAFDWYLWTSVFNRGYSAKFTEKTKTSYRIYEGNTAGLPQEINETSMRKGVEIKLQHYTLVSSQGEHYEQLKKEFQQAQALINEVEWRNEYLKELNSHAVKAPLWWENIRSPVEMGMI